MASLPPQAATVAEPFPIFAVAHKYILYDVDTVSHARAKHNITGVLIGGLPQAPQQNVFSGIPLELMPEEARLLVEKGVAYLVDDVKAHKDNLLGDALAPEERRAFQSALRKQGSAAAKDAERKMEERKKGALEKKFGSSDWNDIPEDMLLSNGKRGGKKGKRAGSRTPVAHSAVASGAATPAEEVESLFSPPTGPVPSNAPPKASQSIAASSSSAEPTPYAVTPTTSTPLLNPIPPPPQESLPLPDVPTSYPLFKHLHEKSYFMSPGLRFGCQYTAYPGDPLRFHSHFLCSGMDWEEEFDLLDIVGGGRLGTGVKKGYLIGGQEPSEGEDKGVRTFCIEWGARPYPRPRITCTCGPPYLNTVSITPLLPHPMSTPVFTTNSMTLQPPAMDRRQFMPRYTSDVTVNVESGHAEPAKTSLSRAIRAAPRSAPPIIPPPPTIPPRNPRRTGGGNSRPTDTIVKALPPTPEECISDRTDGDLFRTQAPSASHPLKPAQRSLSLSTFKRTPLHLRITTSDQRETIGRSLHEEIINLRQSYIDLQSDDVFAPTTPPRRSASSAALRTPVRNFSLPTYSSPTKQTTPPRPLRKVRSRSVNLGPVAEASELPEFPLRPPSFHLPGLPGWDAGEPGGKDADQYVSKTSEGSEDSETLSREKRPTAALKLEHKSSENSETSSHKLNGKDADEHVLSTSAGGEDSEAWSQEKGPPPPPPKLEHEGRCNSCGSTRKALATNPACCVKFPDLGRVCFKCWSALLAERVSKQDRKHWLCCVVCDQELSQSDAKRLANRGTILKCIVKTATSRIRASLPIASGKMEVESK